MKITKTAFKIYSRRLPIPSLIRPFLIFPTNERRSSLTPEGEKTHTVAYLVSFLGDIRLASLPIRAEQLAWLRYCYAFCLLFSPPIYFTLVLSAKAGISFLKDRLTFKFGVIIIYGARRVVVQWSEHLVADGSVSSSQFFSVFALLFARENVAWNEHHL